MFCSFSRKNISGNIISKLLRSEKYIFRNVEISLKQIELKSGPKNEIYCKKNWISEVYFISCNISNKIYKSYFKKSRNFNDKTQVKAFIFKFSIKTVTFCVNFSSNAWFELGLSNGSYFWACFNLFPIKRLWRKNQEITVSLLFSDQKM